MSTLHEDLIVIDGLIVANWSAEVFGDMRKGGLTAAQLHLLRVGGVRRHHGQHRPLERLVPRP